MKSILILFCFSLHIVLCAQTSTTTDGDWNTGANWSSGVPAKDETATITNAMDLNIDLEVDDGDFDINNGSITDDGAGRSLLIQGTGDLDVGGNVTVNSSLDLKNFGNLTIRSGDTLRVGGSAVMENSSTLTIEAGGVLIISGNLDIKNSFVGTVDGKIVVEGNFDGSNFASFSGNGNLQVDGDLDLANSSSVFGSTSSCNPGPCEYGSGEGLPIELIAFEAIFINAFTLEFNWSTAAEINNDYFIIELSEDGKHFYEVLRLKGAGNSNISRQYRQLYTLNVPKELLYCRLTQVDFDGQSETFHPVVARQEIASNNKSGIKLFPNPSNGTEVFVELNNFEAGTCFVELMDSKGSSIYVAQYQINDSGYLKQPLPNLNQLSGGIYLLRVSGRKDRFTERLMIR